jgi:hypothetical protein
VRTSTSEYPVRATTAALRLHEIWEIWNSFAGREEKRKEEKYR